MILRAKDLPKVSILTAGKDPHYALGLLEGLLSGAYRIEFVANDEMQESPIVRNPKVTYLNLRGDQAPEASLWNKVARVTRYYLALLRYAATTDSPLFHILWQNKFEWLDNTLLILFYQFLDKRLVFTAHNVNTRERDGRSGLIDRFSLSYLYRHLDHIFVHSPQMKDELVKAYGVSPHKVTVIPFGVNNVIPRSGLSRREARECLALKDGQKVILFFGNIAPYKGLDLLVEALHSLPECHLLIVGRIKNCKEYWEQVERDIHRKGLDCRVLKRIDYVPDEEVELYFKAADLAVLPYKKIYQSGVIFLAYSFGVPVVVTNVGALADSVEDGVTGFVSAADDARDLARRIRFFFESPMYSNPEKTRKAIVDFVNEEHSWSRVAQETARVYEQVAAMTGKPRRG